MLAPRWHFLQPLAGLAEAILYGRSLLAFPAPGSRHQPGVARRDSRAAGLETAWSASIHCLGLRRAAGPEAEVAPSASYSRQGPSFPPLIGLSRALTAEVTSHDRSSEEREPQLRYLSRSL